MTDLLRKGKNMAPSLVKVNWNIKSGD